MAARQQWGDLSRAHPQADYRRGRRRRNTQDRGAHRYQAPPSEPDPGTEVDMGSGGGDRKLRRDHPDRHTSSSGAGRASHRPAREHADAAGAGQPREAQASCCASTACSCSAVKPRFSGGSPRWRSQASTSAAVTSSGVAGMPAARARAGLRCCVAQFARISGKNLGAVSAGHLDDLDLGTCHPRTGLDEPAERDRLGRADRVECAGAVVGEQLHHQAGQVTRVDDLDRLPRVGWQRHPAATGGAPDPVREPVLPVVRASHLSRPDDRRPVRRSAP